LITNDIQYISWISDNKQVWTVNAGATAADPVTELGARPVPQEPMVRTSAFDPIEARLKCNEKYILANLGMSTNFGPVDLDHLTFPATLKVDWIRVYQREDSINVGCNPPDFPTTDYIEM
jgi:beta-glucan synthesis-associated protein KRE6